MKISIHIKGFKLAALCLGLLLNLLQPGYSQNITLPDTNFRNVLKANYPSVMSGNQLNVTAANNFVFDLIITNANISDLSGIEHFKSVFKIDARNNRITKIPDLSPITNLTYLYLNYNQLSNVNFLLNNKALLQIQLYHNRLESFPELPGFTRLQQLFLSGNQIRNLTGLSHLTNLINLQIGQNAFDSLPDLSGNTALFELHCNQNKLKTLKGIESLNNLKILYCWGNQITDLSALNNNTSLQELYANHNLLTSLPVLSNKTSLKKIAVFNNQLSFEDLLPVTQLSSVTSFSYAPQDTLGKNNNFSIRHLDDLTLLSGIDSEVNDNVYIWKKNGTLIHSDNKGSYSIIKASGSDAGTYVVEVTNPGLPDLTLTRRPVNVSVNPSCMEILSYGYKILSKDCATGTTISIDQSTLGGQTPYTFTVRSHSSADSVFSYSRIIPDLKEGRYQLYLTDNRGCRLQLDEDLTIFKTSDCDPVIAPGSNGNQGSYFIDKPGLVKVIDMNGNIIRELQAPATWDGTRSDGSLADTGYYVIILNNQKLTNITVVR